MGLAEKRIVKAYQEGTYKTLVNEINTLGGYDLDFEVNWESLSNNDYSHIWENTFSQIYFTPIINAFKEITADDMGKEALQESLKKIVIKDEKDNFSPGSAYSFEDNTLIIDHSSYSNADNVEERSKFLTEFLESQL
ncbi:hypothetical protein [Flavivirga algicola]|uniref:Uncharacterized protein n=1 Tax=Flavivirga algicola TaxID=2729136 RepID=A0ABX1RSB7_9FLAO|nr:hypothetical protein [Flavivirga algicola]NMH86441.1 hypothetical protein [Flavivirga algicola]